MPVFVDSDDPIFPRQVTRLGQRFQAVVPTWEEQQELEKERVLHPPSEEERKLSPDRNAIV